MAEASSGGLRLLPEDVLMEIMSRLPVKSLLRFRSVCKNWCSLIQNPRFVALHHNRAKSKNCCNNSILVLRAIGTEVCPPEYRRSYYWSASKLVLSFLIASSNNNETQTPTSLMDDIDMEVSWPPSSELFGCSYRGYVSVIGPCNGIVCINGFVLCNPATREFKILPDSPFSYPRDMQSRRVAAGFGFDPNSNDYKVVWIIRVYEDYDYCPLQVQIYSLGTDSWREIDAIVPISVYDQPCFETLFNGAFHWYGQDCTNLGGGRVDFLESIISFDINEEVIRLIHLPDVCSYMDGKHRSLLVFNESLAMILYKGDEYFDIWVMDEYGVKESWTKQFSLGPLVGINFPLSFWKDGSELLMESSSGQLVSCDLHTQDIKELQVYGVPKTLRVLLYAESLTSIKNCNQLGRWDNPPI